MRSLQPSFRSELAEYQRDTLALWPDDSNDWERALTVEMLKRWLDHPEAEAVWSTVRAVLPPVTVAKFAFDILEARRNTERFIQIVEQAPAVEAKAQVRLKRHLQNQKWEALSFEAAAFGVFKRQKARVLGRQRSAPRRRFILLLGSAFRSMCGQPLDDVVRVLTEIAFDERVTIDAVRGANRPTTRANRQPRDTRHTK